MQSSRFAVNLYKFIPNEDFQGLGIIIIKIILTEKVDMIRGGATGAGLVPTSSTTVQEVARRIGREGEPDFLPPPSS
jgi:hypothetical protein